MTENKNKSNKSEIVFSDSRVALGKTELEVNVYDRIPDVIGETRKNRSIRWLAKRRNLQDNRKDGNVTM